MSEHHAALRRANERDAEALAEVNVESWRAAFFARAAVERLEVRGAQLATLWVFDGNRRARAFYEALGWMLTPDGREIELGERVLWTVRYARAVRG